MRHYFFMLFLMISPFCFGEIQEVMVVWDPKFCIRNCSKELEKAFLDVRNASHVTVFPNDGKALFAWKEGKKGAHKARI